MFTYILNYRWLFRPLWIFAVIIAVIAAFASQPLAFAVQLFTLSVVLLVPAVLWGADPSRWTVIICVAFAACYLIVIAYNYIPLVDMPPEPVEMRMWHAGEWHVIAVVEPELAQKIQTLGLANNVYRLSTWIIVSLIAWLLMARLFGLDKQATACAIVFAIAPSFEALQVIDCKLLMDPFGTGEIALAGEWGEKVPKSACGRLYGDWAVAVPPIICALYIVGIITMRKFKR